MQDEGALGEVTPGGSTDLRALAELHPRRGVTVGARRPPPLPSSERLPLADRPSPQHLSRPRRHPTTAPTAPSRCVRTSSSSAGVLFRRYVDPPTLTVVPSEDRVAKRDAVGVGRERRAGEEAGCIRTGRLLRLSSPKPTVVKHEDDGVQDRPDRERRAADLARLEPRPSRRDRDEREERRLGVEPLHLRAFLPALPPVLMGRPQNAVHEPAAEEGPVERALVDEQMREAEERRTHESRMP